MDALSFLKFWSHTITMSTTTSTGPHLLLETDTESDEDSFFDLELTTGRDFDNKENTNTIIINNKNNTNPEELGINPEGFNKMASKTELSHKESISKRKVLPIEPSSKPQSPIALLKSAPSFRIFTFGRHKGVASKKTEETGEPQKQKKKEAKVLAVKLNIEEPHYSPSLGRDNGMKRHRKEDAKQEKFSKDVLQKYLKLMKPLYAKEPKRKRCSEKMKLSEEVCSASSPMASPSTASVSFRKEKPKHLGKSRSASSANRRDDTLLQQHDGIQSAILHCKRSLNSRGSSMIMSTEGSTVHSVRNSFEDENGAIL